jgi:fatty-acyl-CoA synthase
MMRTPLLLHQVLQRAGQIFPLREVVAREHEGIVRSSWFEVTRRALRLASALERLGIRKGDPVGTLLWNHLPHLELYLGVPAMGGVLHTVNLRLAPAQVRAIIDHAGDRILFVEKDLVPFVREHLAGLESVERVIVVGGEEGGDGGFREYEELVSLGDASTFTPAALDEDDPCGICYTSGTTAEPKGVVYSHRSTMLHALVASSGEAFSLRQSSVVLPVVPMFHVNAWGLPYACALCGSKLVLPGKWLKPGDLLELMTSEEVTMAAGVPTVWMALLDELDRGSPRPPALRSLLVGGSAAPRPLIKGFHERHGIDVIHAWGMTETSPLGTISTIKPHLAQEGEALYDLKLSPGLPGALIELRIRDDDGHVLAHDGKATGELEIRGPWVTDGYLDDPEDGRRSMTEDGWFRTGDVARIDAEGYLRIVDRTKDLVKSGGEWISSVEIENLLLSHPDVKEAAVIAVRDEKWGERPLACVVPREPGRLDEVALRADLEREVPAWQVPDRFIAVESLPRTSVGKIDKKALRRLHPGNPGAGATSGPEA